MTLISATLRRDVDYLDEQGARKLRGTIIAFWRARGKSPEVWVRKLFTSSSPSDSDRVVYIVESDMVGGRPI